MNSRTFNFHPFPNMHSAFAGIAVLAISATFNHCGSHISRVLSLTRPEVSYLWFSWTQPLLIETISIQTGQAVVGLAAVEYLNRVDVVARGLATQFKVPLEEVPARVAGGPLFLSCRLTVCL